MKKTIEALVEKLIENGNGKLSGGFGSVQGGAKLARKPIQNDGICAGTNNTIWGCTNSGDCRLSTNSGSGGCTNSGSCLY